MIKRFKWIIIATVVFITVALLVMPTNQQQEHDVFVEVFSFSNVAFMDDFRDIFSRTQIYHFIITHDGTLISYSGNSCGDCDPENGSITLTVYDRAEITLSEQEFQQISELVQMVSQNHYSEYRYIVLSHQQVIMLYNDNVYGPQLPSLPLSDLASELYRLSTLSPSELNNINIYTQK